jgi:predicted nucleotidyltransferase component of viral defense system
MIHQTHLTAWQAHAPWDKRSKIEQDLRLSRGIAAIFSDPVLAEHLAMRGGTVLHKGHLAPAARYSEDIDLVLIKPMAKDTLELRLRAVLTPVLGTPSGSIVADAWLAVRNARKPSKLLRTVFSFVPLGLRHPMTVKVEVNINENKSLFPLVEVDVNLLSGEGELKTCRARSYEIHELLGTKLRALMQRRQGRDLFDLYHAAEFGSKATPICIVDGARTVEAFSWYLANENEHLGLDEAERWLNEALQTAAFRNDMKTLLRPDLGHYDVDFAAQLVRNKYLVYLDE